MRFSDVRGITNRKHVEEGYEQVSQALLEYTVTCYPQIQVKIYFTSTFITKLNNLWWLKVVKHINGISCILKYWIRVTIKFYFPNSLRKICQRILTFDCQALKNSFTSHKFLIGINFSWEFLFSFYINTFSGCQLLLIYKTIIRAVEIIISAVKPNIRL